LKRYWGFEGTRVAGIIPATPYKVIILAALLDGRFEHPAQNSALRTQHF